jgi:DivIVA domain-containing protein
VDRDTIQRRDFPLGRRGYDPAAVDAHLRAVADQLAAERSSAAGLSDQAGAHAAEVQAAAAQVVDRLDGLQNDLDGLLESLKRSGRALEDGLARLRAATRGADDGRAGG